VRDLFLRRTSKSGGGGENGGKKRVLDGFISSSSRADATPKVSQNRRSFFVGSEFGGETPFFFSAAFKSPKIGGEVLRLFLMVLDHLTFSSLI